MNISDLPSVAISKIILDLDVKSTVRISSTSKKMQEIVFRNVIKIDLSEMHDLGNKIVLNLVEKCEKLEYLDLTTCMIEDSILPHLASKGTIKTLSLLFCPKITAKGILYVSKKMPNTRLIA